MTTLRAPPAETCASCPFDCGVCDPCAGGGACGTCTPMSGCGWCETSGRCLSGTASGSNDRSCSGKAWDWETRDCPTPDPCASSANWGGVRRPHVLRLVRDDRALRDGRRSGADLRGVRGLAVAPGGVRVSVA